MDGISLEYEYDMGKISYLKPNTSNTFGQEQTRGDLHGEYRNCL